MIDLLSGLPTPTPDAMRAARGDMTQGEAAQACGLASGLRWSEYERGVRTIDMARWAVFLLATGQHPIGRIARRTRATARANTDATGDGRSLTVGDPGGSAAPSHR